MLTINLHTNPWVRSLGLNLFLEYKKIFLKVLDDFFFKLKMVTLLCCLIILKLAFNLSPGRLSQN